ncbi:hypothetical protein R0J93_12880 [Pseudoalteromonas sp. SIMBA_148]
MKNKLISTSKNLQLKLFIEAIFGYYSQAFFKANPIEEHITPKIKPIAEKTSQVFVA